MSSQTTRAAESSRPVKFRRLHVLIFRLGILSAFLVALGVALTGFALFECTCTDNNLNLRKVERMIVNPPDPSTKPPAYLLKR
jgi:hypothetical protein